jgi:uncharacterized protein (TIGR00251 family)
MIPIRDSPQGASFAIKVHPRAKKTAITGTFGEGADAALKVALSAPPVEGRANEALIEFFAELCGVPRSAVSVLSGAQSRNKVLRIAGRSAEEIQRAIMAE